MESKKRYKIFYNDGALYGEISFINKTNKFIQKFFSREIKDNNKNINKNYHIDYKNIKRVEL